MQQVEPRCVDWLRILLLDEQGYSHEPCAKAAPGSTPLLKTPSTMPHQRVVAYVDLVILAVRQH
ncbi:MAG: hypothetical protein E6I93_03690 [Chloroflexi bacterium]|nr:MAG: hypothetical protein E6I93_03690 [Chloroflexota bacterium]